LLRDSAVDWLYPAVLDVMMASQRIELGPQPPRLLIGVDAVSGLAWGRMPSRLATDAAEADIRQWSDCGLKIGGDITAASCHKPTFTAVK
jgi:hypothetical protein